MSYQDEERPYFVGNLPEKIQELALGDDHTLLLTRSGEVYSMGCNAKGQLGTGGGQRNVPVLL